MGLLTPRRAATLVGILGVLALWGAGAGGLPDLPNGWDVALTAIILIPATFTTVWVALPLAETRGFLLPSLAVAFGVAAVAFDSLGWATPFELAKLVGLTLAGFWFLSLFEEVWWIALVALVIPVVDSLSVYRGPTKVVIDEKPGLFDRISLGFRLPGENDGARLGPPDVLFFALFLAAAQRFRLRVGWTWIGMSAGLAATLLATYAFDLSGLPALPGIAFGFLIPNADLLLHAAREARRGTAAPES